jgi:MFS transporter, DHA1 family, tetracycline resistance protein
MCAPEELNHRTNEADKSVLAEVVPLSLPANTKADPYERDLRRGILFGTASLALLFVAITVAMPHTQSQRDKMGCDTMCVGSMTSARSMLTLTGATIVGKLSDSTSAQFQRMGGARRVCLLLGVVAVTTGLLMGYFATNIQMLWASMIPGALMEHNADILKALFSSYHDAATEKSSSTDRAASAGLLGMAVGLALMAGPLAGVTLFSTYQQATYFGMVCVVLATILVLCLPVPKASPAKNNEDTKAKGFFSALDTRSARTPAAVFLMATRVFMALAFHIFQTIWTASLRERFDFGPKEYGRFISFVGLTYALSQGFLAKALLKFFGGHTAKGRVRLLLACCVCLGCGRYLAFHTTSLPVVYGLFGAIVTCLGLINTMFSADTSQIATPDEIGSLFGVLAAVESVAGMAGPLAGGALSYIHPIKAPLYTVVALYVIVFVMVLNGYETLVLNHAQDKKRAVDPILHEKSE